MALVTFKDLCIDAADVAAVAGFWSQHLGLEREDAGDGDVVLRGPSRTHSVWINLVPDAAGAKNRVHLDLRAGSLEPFAGLEQLTEEGEFAWTVFADPEGNQFCVFTVDEPPPLGLKDVGVDSVNPTATAAWWADVWGATLVHENDYSHVDDIPGAPVDSFDFAAVPEPKTVKNRMHWDVTLTAGSTVDDLVEAGASVLAAASDQQAWTVMADPEGNEFCVFALDD